MTQRYLRLTDLFHSDPAAQPCFFSLPRAAPRDGLQSAAPASNPPPKPSLYEAGSVS